MVENIGRDREYPEQVVVFHSLALDKQYTYTDKTVLKVPSTLALTPINHTLRLLSPPLTISIVHPPSLLLPVGSSGLSARSFGMPVPVLWIKTFKMKNGLSLSPVQSRVERPAKFADYLDSLFARPACYFFHYIPTSRICPVHVVEKFSLLSFLWSQYSNSHKFPFHNPPAK